MAVEFICDGCGKKEPARYNYQHDAIKPSKWYERGDEEGVQHACSTTCIEKVAKETGKTALVLPI